MKAFEVITYSLRAGEDRSDQFYRDLALFTDQFISGSTAVWGESIPAYMAFLEHEKLEKPRTFPEYAYELLSLGVLWRVYAGNLFRLPKLPQRSLAYLARLRDNHPRLKPPVDYVRGQLMAWFMASKSRPAEIPAPNLENMDRLLAGLSASGNFNQIVDRLKVWQKFLARQERENAERILASAIAFAARFEQTSLAVLGLYTPNVEPFLAEKLPAYRGRQDYIFCGRQRVEYHMSMVGTEILNRSFREEFQQAQTHVVVVPPCMCAPAEKCQAKSTPFGSRCAACTPGCRVNQLTKLGEKKGFQVFILPDELKVFSTPKGNGSQKRTGIIGISCVLTNAPGGWDMKDLGIPAQGVFLDYCGCSYHWHKDGIPTDTNFHRIVDVVGGNGINPS